MIAMKNIPAFLCLYLALTLSLAAQSPNTFRGEAVELSPSQQQQVESHSCDYRTFRFPLADFRRFLQYEAQGSAGATCEIYLGEDLHWSVELWENDLRSRDFIRSQTGARGPVDALSLRPNINYRGQLAGQPDNWLRWTVADDFWSGLSLVNGEKYRMESLGNWLPDEELADVYILYQAGSRHCESNLATSCWSPHPPAETPAEIPLTRQTNDPPQRYLELAADVDYEFYEDYDFDVVQVEQTIQARINEIDGVYQNQLNMAVILVYLNIWTTPNDPYTGNKDTLYYNVFYHWLRNNPCVHRDVVHLFSGREGLGASGGVNIEGVRSICGAHDFIDAQFFPNQLNAYACGWARTVRAVDSWEITAHELAHNFGVPHNCTSYLMCHNAGTCECAVGIPQFHPNSVTAFHQYLNGLNGAYPEIGEFANDICLTEPDPEDLANNALVEQERAQMALAELPGPTTLPNANGSTYNYGQASFNTIPQFTIEAGGYLRINDLGPTGYGSGPASNQVHFAANTLRCGSYITVKDGGYFILGNDDGAVSGGNHATVCLREHGTIRVKKGGTLRLARGSHLIVEPGAELWIEEGANMELWWSESTIQIQGTLRMTGQFNFDGSGFLQFDENHVMYLPEDGFRLHGQGDRFLRLNKNTDWRLHDKALDLKNGAVEYADHARISVGEGGSVLARQDDFPPRDNGTNNYGFYAVACTDLDFQLCSFTGLEVGIQAAEVASDGELQILYSNFEDCTVGIFAYDFPVVNVQHSQFTGAPNSFAAVLAERVDLLGLVSCRVEDYPTGDLPSGALNLREVERATLTGTDLLDNRVGASLFQVLDFDVWGGRISGSDLGIYLLPGELDVNRTKVALREGATVDDNAVGILVEKGGVDVQGPYGTVLMDCATLDNNGVGIQGEDVALEIDAYAHCNCSDPAQANPNTLLKDEQNILGSLLFDICYRDLGGSFNLIAARGNYWGSALPQVNEDYRFRVNSSDGPCVGASDLLLWAGSPVAVVPVACNHGDGPDRPRATDRNSAADSGARELQLFPNPTNSSCRITAPWSVFHWRVYNTKGEEWGAGRAHTSLDLGVADWPAGLYWVELWHPLSEERAIAPMIVY